MKLGQVKVRFGPQGQIPSQGLNYPLDVRAWSSCQKHSFSHILQFYIIPIHEKTIVNTTTTEKLSILDHRLRLLLCLCLSYFPAVLYFPHGLSNFPQFQLFSHGLGCIPTDSDYNYAWWGCNLLYTCPTALPSPFCCCPCGCPLFSSSPRRRQTTTTRRHPRREHLSLVLDVCEIFPKRRRLSGLDKNSFLLSMYFNSKLFLRKKKIHFFKN